MTRKIDKLIVRIRKARTIDEIAEIVKSLSASDRNRLSSVIATRMNEVMGV